MKMITEEADRYRDYFPQKTPDANRAIMTMAEYSAGTGGFACTVCLDKNGRLSDTLTENRVCFSVRPVLTLPS
ncbi:MAG: hypothetical protein LBD42_03045 [Desulfovibrio sp.]|nr:hypothetical protein [Desulfovibrio sp.]